MLKTAQQALDEGRRQLRRGSVKIAHPFFRQAFEMDQQSVGGGQTTSTWVGGLKIKGDPTIISYYALGYGMEETEMEMAVKLARWSVSKDKSAWEHHCNLAHLYFHDGNRRSAVKHIGIAHRLSNNDERVEKLWEEIGKRNDPALPFLKRSHPVNKYLGLLKNRLLG